MEVFSHLVRNIRTEDDTHFEDIRVIVSCRYLNMEERDQLTYLEARKQSVGVHRATIKISAE
jgi:hypothetical protein